MFFQNSSCVNKWSNNFFIADRSQRPICSVHEGGAVIPHVKAAWLGDFAMVSPQSSVLVLMAVNWTGKAPALNIFCNYITPDPLFSSESCVYEVKIVSLR